MKEFSAKKALCVVLLAVFVSAFAAAQQVKPAEAVTTTVNAYLSPVSGGKGQAGEKLLVLHFKSPAAALNEWAIDRFTEGFKSRGTAPVERRNRPAAAAALGEQFAVEISDADAAAIGKAAGVKTVFTGVFTSAGKNWNLDIHAVSVESAKNIWSRKLVITPNAAFLKLATPDVQAQPASAPASAPVAAANAPAAPAPAAAAKAPAAPAPAAVERAPAPVTPAAAGALKNGTYSFRPRLRVNQGGVNKDLYLDRVTVKNEYFTVFVTGSARDRGGRGAYRDYSQFWDGGDRVLLTDLDNTSRTWNFISKGDDDDVTGGYYYTFQNVTGRRFKFSTSQATPPYVVDEIILGEPDS
jgi:hypothetical protein